MAAKKRNPIDWDSIEKEYRMGQKTMRTIADEFGVNVSNISRRAKKENWVQDKSEEIRQRTKAALIAQHERNTPTREDIDVAVQTNKDVIIGHRKSIGNSQRMVDLLTSQLRDAAENRDELEGEVEGECIKPDGNTDYQKRNRLLKAISLPAHAAVLRDLSTAQKNLIALERQAFNIDETDTRKTVDEINIEFVPASTANEN